ncbi:MAG: Ig-like domain-containing protein, partial [Clostridium sp.]|nr:Ig-like domain-containing protein [Clostridium sp.]
MNINKFIKTNIKVVPILALILSFIMIFQPVVCSAAESEAFVPLEESNLSPLVSSKKAQQKNEVENNKELNITIGLKFRNKSELKQKINSEKNQGKSGKLVSSNELANNFLPSKSSNDKVIEFLEDNGFKITKTYSEHMIINASASVKDIEKAFDIKLYYYTYNGKGFFSNSSEPKLPQDIASLVQNISGLNNLKLSPSNFSSRQINPSYISNGAYTPQQIQTAYDFNSAYSNNLNGKGVKIAIASYYSFNQSDINAFVNKFGISTSNSISTINVDGTPESDANGSEETTMDIECALSSAPGSQVLLYNGANPDLSTQTDIFNKIVEDGQADVVSYSWGTDEQNYTQAELTEMNNIFMAGTAKGMTFVVASGDYGSGTVDYPADDPYVTAVGGTTLKTDSSSGKISSETGWNLDSNGSGSGGGISTSFSIPSWQKGLISSNNSNRMIPDVSLNANPNTGYSIYYGKSWYEAGGTSASAPEWAAIFALVDQSRKEKGIGNIGFANPILYSLKNTSAFNDVTSGDNGKYSCLTGYDMVTGIGSANVGQLVSALSNSISNIYSNYKAIGCIDAPSEAQSISGVKQVSGWFLDGTGVNKIEVLVDGNVVGTASYGDSRSDVGKVFPQYSNANSGYHYSLDTTKLTNGKHTLVIRETGNNGIQTSVSRGIMISNGEVGCIDAPSEGQSISGVKQVSGWLLDGTGVSKVEVLVDGNVVGTASYEDSRSDVEKAFPQYNNVNSGYHYSLDTTKLTDGNHTLVIRETGNNGSQNSISRGINVCNKAIGCIDVPSEGQSISGVKQVSGWFLDGTGVSKVEVLVDGNVVGTASYGDLRSDVGKVFPQYNNANSGYHYSLDTTKVTNGNHTLVIREMGSNGIQTSVSRGITISNGVIGCIDAPSEGQSISGVKQVSGWFLDGTGVSKIEVLVDGNVVGTASYGDSRGDVEKAFPQYNNANSGYHYSLDTTKLTDGNHALVIRETGNNGSQNNVSRGIMISNGEVGCIDAPSEGQSISGVKQVSGWLLDGTGVSK